MDDWRTFIILWANQWFKYLELTTSEGKYKEGHLKGQK